jgi:hypothetical protein
MLTMQISPSLHVATPALAVELRKVHEIKRTFSGRILS